MKVRYFKYLFFIFILGIMIFAFIKIKGDEQKKDINGFEAREENVSEIKELKLGIVSFDSINPILSKNKSVQDFSKLIFEPLMSLSSDYKLQLVLASEWAKQNDKVYLIKLKNDKKWSDGKSFTAEDVKFTIDKLKEVDSIYSSNVQHIIEVEVVDKSSIKITLDEEVPFFEYNLTFPILSKAYYENKEFSLNIVPIGTGMYKVSDVQESSLILNKNDYYEDKDNLKLEDISITIYASAGELYNAFKIGNIDLISTQNTNLKQYIGTIGYLSKEMKGREHDFIAFNVQSEFFSQINLRKAVVYSIDKTNIVSSVFSDNYYISSFPLDYGNWLYNELDTSSGYNVDQAKQILQNDGWSYRYKSWQKTQNYKTTSLIIDFVVKASDTSRVKVAENIKNQLENQGIKVNLIKASDEQYYNYLINKNYDMILCSINLSISPDLSTFFGANNLANYSNTEVDDLMNEIKNTTDENKLKDDYKRLAEVYKVDMPYLSLYNNKYTVVYNTNLVGFNEMNWFYQFYNLQIWHK